MMTVGGRPAFGDVLGGFTLQLAISECADKFMGIITRRCLTESIYMDDIMLFSNIKSMTEKGDFQVKY